MEWGVDLQTEHERFLSEELFKKPVIVTDYPKDIKAFYMRVNDDNKTVRAMDVLVPRVGEIIGGSQREDRHDVLLQRLRDSGLDEKAYWWYFDLRRYGSVPHSGFGLGLERMMMYLTGLKNIRDVIPFPRTPGMRTSRSLHKYNCSSRLLKKIHMLTVCDPRFNVKSPIYQLPSVRLSPCQDSERFFSNLIV